MAEELRGLRTDAEHLHEVFSISEDRIEQLAKLLNEPNPGHALDRVWNKAPSLSLKERVWLTATIGYLSKKD